MSRKIVVNIPAYNEEKTIGAVITRIPSEINGHDVEVLVVDDGSHDATVHEAEKAGAHRVISHRNNRGVGQAFQTAVEYFYTSGADIFVNIDADGQFPPEQIQDLVKPIIDGQSDMVLGSRFSGTDAHNMPWIKRTLNKVIARTIGKMMGTTIDDLTCGFRAYSRELLMHIYLVSSYTYTQEIIIDAIAKGYRLQWVPVEVTYFADRKSRVVKSITKYIAKSVLIIVRTVRDARPLLFFGVPGLVLSITGLLFLAFFAGAFLLTSQTTPYRTRLWVGSLLFSAGMLLAIFASIADMIKRQRMATEENIKLSRKIFFGKKLLK